MNTAYTAQNNYTSPKISRNLLSTRKDKDRSTLGFFDCTEFKAQHSIETIQIALFHDSVWLESFAKISNSNNFTARYIEQFYRSKRDVRQRQTWDVFQFFQR